MQDLQRTPKRDAVELSGRLLDTADYVAAKFQEAYVAGFAAKIPGRQLAAIAVIRNGTGPTAFLMAGNHGDEYEGQIALCKLIRAIDPAQVQGRVIVMPAANLPAAMASDPRSNCH
jgi:predicted deacylase